MSEPVSALGGLRYEGFVRVEELAPRGMVTLRGDLGSEGLRRAVRDLTGLDVPDTRGMSQGAEHAVAWMSPDELLLLMPHADAPEAVTQLQAALAGEHAMAVEVSDARAMFRLAGPGVREVVAKLAPVDMSRAAFGPGMIRRTRVAQVAAALWMPEEDCVELVCFRSVAAYVFGLLKVSAARGGEVRAGY